jgi:hypothetical protein
VPPEERHDPTRLASLKARPWHHAIQMRTLAHGFEEVLPRAYATESSASMWTIDHCICPRTKFCHW